MLVSLALVACTAQPPLSSPTAAPSATTSVHTTETPTPVTFIPPTTEAASLSGTVVIDGSSTVFPITEAAGIAFRSYAPGVDIQLGVSGTGGGLKKFCAGEVAIADASRPISASEAAACTEADITYIELPIAFDGISVVVHPQNSWAECMTVAELKALWEPQAEHNILRWSQLRSGWPDTPIALYGAGGDSGTYDYFTQAIVGTAHSSRSDYTPSEDDYLLAQDLAADPQGLGFFGYAYYVEYAGALRAVAIDNGAGCVAPSASSIADGSYQPLARPMFLYVRVSALDRPEIRAFVDFYLTNGSALVRQARSIPLPDEAYPLVAERVARRLAGSVFEGGSQVGISIDQLLRLEEQK